MQHGRECQNVVHGLGLVLMKMFVKCLYENVFSNYLKYIIFIIRYSREWDTENTQ